MDKELHIQTEEIQKDGKDTYYCHKYEPTSYEVLDILFKVLELQNSDGFVDYGCGMGRLNFYVHHTFHCRSMGIELNTSYYTDACKNLTTYSKYNKTAKQDIHFVNEKAENYEVHNQDTVFYFFNPFSIEIFRKVVAKIQKSMEKNWRKVRVILYYPDEEYTYFLDECTCFDLDMQIKVDRNGKDEREGFLIYSCGSNDKTTAQFE